jgi:hypothetical protein
MERLNSCRGSDLQPVLAADGFVLDTRGDHFSPLLLEAHEGYVEFQILNAVSEEDHDSLSAQAHNKPPFKANWQY